MNTNKVLAISVLAALAVLAGIYYVFFSEVRIAKDADGSLAIYGQKLNEKDVEREHNTIEMWRGYYEEAVLLAVSEGTIERCRSLHTKHMGLFMDEYIRYTSGGKLYPRYGNWAPKSYCVYGTAMVHKDETLCDDAYEYELLNDSQLETCKENVRDAIRGTGTDPAYYLKMHIEA